MLKLYKFYWYCGRQGNLEGLFIADELEVSNLMGSEVNFGESLGKHSQVDGVIEEDDLEILSEDQEFLNKLIEVVGSQTISGYNPFNFLREEEEEE